MEEEALKAIDSTTTPETVPQRPRSLTRREFLKTGAKAAFLTAIAFKGLETAFSRALFYGLTNPAISDKATSTALEVSQKAPNSENPNYRPMADLIKEGVSSYQDSTDNPVFFQRIEEYESPGYYANVMKKFNQSSLMPQSPAKAAREFINSLPREAFEAYFQSSFTNSSFEELFTSGSGFDARFREKHPELVHGSGLYLGSDEIPELMSQEGKSEIDELKQKVEEKTKEKGKPVSASFILAHFLEKNKGNISHSIFDTAIFLKFMARNDPESGDFSPTALNVKWYRQNIKDEYQGPTYTTPPKGEAAINLIGKPYHTWNLVALLQFIPVEVVRVGGIQKQLSTFKEQGLGKTRSDLQTLRELKDIEQLLLSYSPPEPN